MELRAPAARSVRVGGLDLDLESGELVRDGARLRLQVQSLELLKALLERPGTMVAREDLRRRLWPDDTFVDFDHGLNAAVRRLREALGDSADAPRFVETVPRKGYRLIAPVDNGSGSTPAAPEAAAAGESELPPGRLDAVSPPPVPRPSRKGWVLAAGLAMVCALAAWRWTERPPPAAARPPVALLTDRRTGWLVRCGTGTCRRCPPMAATSRLRRPAPRKTCGSGCARSGPTCHVRSRRGHRPFWSPDSSTIGFFAYGTLSSVLVAGGSIEKRAIAPLMGGGTWMTNGDILFTPVRGGAIHRLAGGAGRSEPVTEVDTTGGELGHDWPYAVPGTDRFTFLSRRSGANEAVARLGEIGARTTTALGLTDSRAVPTASGHLLWVRDGTLMAQRLDATRSRLVGHSTAIAHDVAVRPFSLGHFTASDDAIVFLTRDAATAAVHMTMFDRGGATVAHLGDVGEYSSPRVSPDGNRVAVARRDPQTGTRDIWIHDLTGKPPLRLTFDRHDDTAPVWSADGRTIFFTSDRRGERDLYRKDAGAQQPERLLYASGESKSLNAVSRDGRMLIYDTGARGSVDREGRFNSSDLQAVSLTGTPTVLPIADTPAHEDMGDLSPDGTLIAYHSSEAGGRREVFVETFPAKGGRWQVTTEGGAEPVWRADGRELFFLTPAGSVAAVDVQHSESGVRFGATRVLFAVRDVHADVRLFAPFPDGRRFIVLTDAKRSVPQRMTVLMNWRSALADD